MTGPRRSRWANPVLTKELRTRVRTVKSWVIMTVYVLVMVGSLGATWYFQVFYRRLTSLPAPSAAEFSRAYFLSIVAIQALLVSLMAPAFTSGAISLEREKQTLELLLLTPVSRRAIVLGKLGASLAHLGLVVVCGLPASCGICLMLGGVAPIEILVTHGAIMLCAVFFGSLGIAMSAVSRRTSGAVAAAYVLTLVFAVGTLAGDLLVEVLGHYSTPDPAGFLVLCPPVAVLSLVSPDLQTELTKAIGAKPWMVGLGVYALLSLLCVLEAMVRLEPERLRKRRPRRAREGQGGATP